MLDWLLAQDLPAIEWSAVVLALVYVVLAARNSVWCWPFAFISSCLWAWQVYFAYDLVYDTVLNVFYAVMAVVGLWQWFRPTQTKKALPITWLPLRIHVFLIVGGLATTCLLFVLAKAYSSAAIPGLDALTTVFSIIGTYLLIKRHVENWIYLFAMDVIYVYLYLERGSVLFAALFVLYCILAMVGFWSWLHIMSEKTPENPEEEGVLVESV